MSETVIQARGLGKKYQLGTIGYGTLRHDLQAWWARMRGREDPNAQIGGKSRIGLHGDLWALQDVNFDVKRGDRVGVIGRNGAGKSTLLKILSRITQPTEGVVRMKGKVASLLEVGTGFHPELTGRENVFLNGAIMGMKRREIQRKFDEIVDFAEVEEFVDTPVKRYSSGMYVRLAFAVAAHLEPDILLIDEVLAVGDMSFQKKCLGKMEDVSLKQGRTILFVSHNMGAVSSLCNKCILLSAGSLASMGRTSEIILRYYSINDHLSGSRAEYTSGDKTIGDSRATLLSAWAENASQREATEFTIHDRITVHMRYRILRELSLRLVPNFHFYTAEGRYAFVSSPEGIAPMNPGDVAAVCEIPADFLNEGTYTVGLALTAYSDKSMNIVFFERDALSFHVRDPMDEKSRRQRYGYGGEIPGVVRPRLAWTVAHEREA